MRKKSYSKLVPEESKKYQQKNKFHDLYGTITMKTTSKSKIIIKKICLGFDGTPKRHSHPLMCWKSRIFDVVGENIFKMKGKQGKKFYKKILFTIPF